MKRLVVLLILPLLALVACQETYVLKNKQSDLRLKKIGSFNQPVWLEEKSGSLFIVEKEGRIIRRQGGEKTVWLDIKDKVKDSGEQGLLSLAFSPKDDNLFYIYYTDNQGDQIVAEGEVSPSPKIRRTVLKMEDFASNHNGGQLSFGPGGLYIATGDGGGSGDPERTAQSRRSLLGKMLRIIPYKAGKKPYTIPADNPFINGGGRREIFSLGLRNPWRFSISRGRIWIGDVGQDKQEEISAPSLRRARGGNFGWSAWEGKLPFNSDQKVKNPIWPVLTYGRSGGCSVTGGYFIESLGSLKNRYLYGDFCTGKIRSFYLKNGRARGDRSEGLQVPALVSFAKSKEKVWLISLDGGIFRLLSA